MGMEYGRIRESYELFVDLESPEGSAGESPDLTLDWQHTLTVGDPVALRVDRDRDRLYLVEINEAEGFLRMYDTGNHSQNRANPIGLQQDLQEITASLASGPSLI